MKKSKKIKPTFFVNFSISRKNMIDDSILILVCKRYTFTKLNLKDLAVVWLEAWNFISSYLALDSLIKFNKKK